MPQNPLHTLLRLSIAFIWIWTGIVVILLYPLQDSLALMAPIGLPENLTTVIIWLTALFEIFLGIVTAFNWRVGLWALVQIVLVTTFTLILTVISPELWLHPFGPISKNVPLVAALIILYSWERQKAAQRRRLYSFHDELQ